MPQQRTTRASSAAWLFVAFGALALCSCRTSPWQSLEEPAMDAVPNTRHMSNWDRVHEGNHLSRTMYTHQPREYQLPQMPVPEGPPTSHQNLQAAYNAPPLPRSAYHDTQFEVVPCGHQDCEGCRKARPGIRGHYGATPGFCREDGAGGYDGPECMRMPDEYICDGGDRETNVSVLHDWTVRGLDTEDTIAHFDTLQGKTHVEVSNRVCIYAPRFAAVRTVKGMAGHQQSETLIAARDRQLPHLDNIDFIVTTSVQNVQPLGQFGLKPVNIYEGRDLGTLLEKTYIPAKVSSNFLPHEDFKLIRLGIYDLADKPRLSAAIDNAIAWTSDQSVKVSIDGKLPVEASNNFAAEQMYVYDIGKSRLRIVKTASQQNAKPGEIVDFTLRFDNIGDQTIGNVTVIDSLTTRLEYVENSVQSSVAADFYTQQNEGDSLVLRFEVVDPVKVGEGGVIRFQARVR